MRMYGIDTPEMPGACRPGRACTPGDPYAARDHLADLTRGKTVRCKQMDTDAYGRRVVRCTANAVDISCAMVASGYAVERYGRLGCGNGLARRLSDQFASPADVIADYPLGEAPRPGRIDPPRKIAPVAAEPGTKLSYVPQEVPPAFAMPWLAIAIWLVLINLATYAAFAIDKRRAVSAMHRSSRRIPEKTLLTLAALGGSGGAIAAQQRLRHKTRKQPFANWLLVIIGLQIGCIVGVAALAW